MTRRHDAGFTLIEVLVALAILSLVLAAFYGSLSGSSARLRRGDQQAIAVRRAIELSQRLRVDLPIRPTSGHYDDGMSWRLAVTPVASRTAIAGTVGIGWVIIAVLDERGNELARLETAEFIP